MAKRFTASDKWDDPWFYELPDKDKLFWIFILDRCDMAGVWKVNWRMTESYLGYRPNLDSFGGRIVVLSEGKLFVPGFIRFQYGELNPANRMHRGVLSALRGHGVASEEGPSKAHQSPINGAKDKDKDKDKAVVVGGVGGMTPAGTLIRYFAQVRGIDLSNHTLFENYYREHLSAAVMLYEITGSNLELAKQAIAEITKYLNKQQEAGKIEFWKNLQLIVKYYPEWKAELDRSKK